MLNKKFGAIPILLIFALTITGFAYAHWAKTLFIGGTVETGTLECKFVPPLVMDDNEIDKNVGGHSGYISDDGKSIIITITNAYPGYEVYTVFKVKNTGSVPAIITDVIIDEDATTPPPDDIPDLEVSLVNLLGMQLEPGVTTCAEVDILIEQPAGEMETYQVSVTIVAQNWSPP